MKVKNYGTVFISLVVKLTNGDARFDFLPNGIVEFPDKEEAAVDAAIKPYDNLKVFIENKEEDILINQEIADAITTHNSDPSAHSSEIGGAVTDHVAQADPHTQYQKESEKGAPNGYVGLDAGQKVPVNNLPHSVMEFQDYWNAATNTPALADGVGDRGDIWEVSVAGTQDLGSGSQTFAVGEWVVYTAGNVWKKANNSSAAIPDASPSVRGVVSISAQTFGGKKDFQNGLSTPITASSANDVVNKFLLDSKVNANLKLVTTGLLTFANSGSTGTISQNIVNAGSGAAAAPYLAQSFVVSAPTTLSAVSFVLRRFNAGSGNIQAQVVGNLAGQPNIADIKATSAQVDSTGMSSSFSSILFNFSGEVIQAGTYWVIVELVGNIAVQFAGNGGMRSSDNGLNWTAEPFADVNYVLSGSTDTSSVTLTADAFVQVAGLPDASNKVAAFTHALGDGQVAYVTLNKTSSPATLAVSYGLPSAVVNDPNNFIIARRKGTNIYFSDNLVVNDASVSQKGLVTISAQTFGGLKTFNDGVVALKSSRFSKVLGEGQVFTITGDVTAGSNLISNIVGALPSALQQANHVYAIQSANYIGWSQELESEVPVASFSGNTLLMGTGSLKSGTGVTFYVQALAVSATDDQVGSVSSAGNAFVSGSAVNGSSGAVIINSGNVTNPTSATATMGGINYASSLIGKPSNSCSVSVVLDATLTAVTSGSLANGNLYIIGTYVSGDNFTNIGGTNASGTIFRTTGSTPTSWANGSTLYPVFITGLGISLIARLPSAIAVSRDMLLSGIQIQFNNTHDFIATTAGGANSTQVAGQVFLSGAIGAGTVSVGGNSSGVVAIDSPYINFTFADQFNQVFLQTANARGANNSATLFITSGYASGSGNTGNVSIRSQDSQGTGGTGGMTIRTGAISNSTASGAFNMSTGSQRFSYTTGNTGSMSMVSGSINGTAGNTGGITIASGAVNNTISPANSTSGAVNISSGTNNSTASVSTTGALTFLSGGNATNSSGATGGLTIRSGNLTGTGSGTTGAVNILTGTKASGSTGNTGSMGCTSGNNSGAGNSGSASYGSGSTVTGSTGGASLRSGNSTSGNTGQLTLNSGNTGGAGNSGNIEFASGSVVNGTTGYVHIYTGVATGSGNTNDASLGSGSTTTGLSGDAGVYTGNATSGNTGTVYVRSGNTSGAGNTGSANLSSGTTTGTGTTGVVSINSGDTNSGSSGQVYLRSGNSTSGNTGSLGIYTGFTGAGASSGNIDFGTGSTVNGTAGYIHIYTGSASGTGNTSNVSVGSGDTNSGNTGDAALYSGNSTSGATGNITVRSGSTGAGANSGQVNSSSGNVVNGTSGVANWTSGNATGTGNSGTLYVSSGSVFNGTSGNVTVQSGTHNGTAGNGTASLFLQTGQITGALATGGSTSGHIFITTGAVTNASSVSNSGDLKLATGGVAGSGSRGRITVDATALKFFATGNAAPQDGDVWFDGTNLKLQTGGVTKVFTAV